MNFIDVNKPILKDGEKLCDGCWAVSKDTTNWVWYNFKYLKLTLLCQKCVTEKAEHIEKLQKHRL